MNVDDVKRIHALAMAIDSRVKPMDDHGVMARAWQVILADVPAEETDEILKHLYREPQILVLQPGHIAEAWEQLREQRALTLRRIAGIDRYLAADIGDPPEITAAKRADRARLVETLPPRIRRTLEPATLPR